MDDQNKLILLEAEQVTKQLLNTIDAQTYYNKTLETIELLTQG